MIICPLIMVVGIMIGFSYYAINYLDAIIEKFNTVSNEATTLVLNGDRDFYQALAALEDLKGLSSSSDELKSAVADYEENSQQTHDRINDATALVLTNVTGQNTAEIAYSNELNQE